MELSLTYSALYDIFSRSLSIIGKRAVDDKGNTLFKDITFGTREKELASDYFRQGALDIVDAVPNNMLVFHATTEGFVMNIRLFNETLGPALQEAIKDYCVAHALYEWLTITAPTLSELYKGQRDGRMATIIKLVMNRAEPSASPASYSDLTGAIITPDSPVNPDPEPEAHEAFGVDSDWYNDLFSDQAQGVDEDIVHFPVTRIVEEYQRRGNLTINIADASSVDVYIGDEELLTSLPLALPGRARCEIAQGTENGSVVSLPWTLTDDDFNVLRAFTNDERIVFITTEPVVATYTGEQDNPVEPDTPEPQPVEHEAFSEDSDYYSELFSDDVQGIDDDIVHFPVKRITDLYNEHGNLTISVNNTQRVYVMMGDKDLLTSLPLTLPGCDKDGIFDETEEACIVELPWVLTNEDINVLSAYTDDEEIVFFTTEPVVATYTE